MSLFDLSATVNDLCGGTYTVTRGSTAGTFDANGYAVPPSRTTFAIRASVQPLTGYEIDRLPEGLATHEVVKLYTATLLNTQTSTQDPDIVTIGNDTYQVNNVQGWPTLGNFYKVLCTKENRR